jgi:hypothetical protein
MKRRLVLLATAIAIVGGSAGVASAGSAPKVGGPIIKPGQTCLVFYHQDHSKPTYLCLDY